MSRADAIDAKQSRQAIRSHIKATLVLAGLGIACVVMWGWVLLAKVFFGAAAFALLIAGYNLGIARFSEAKLKKEATEGIATGRDFTPNTDFEFFSDDEEGDRYERRLIVGGRPMTITVAPKLFDQAKPRAVALVASLNQVLSKFAELKARVAGRHPEIAEEIKGVEISHFLYGWKYPVVEVYFAEESCPETWEAEYDQDRGEFQNFVPFAHEKP